MADDLRQQLCTLIEDVFMLDPGTVQGHMSAIDVDGWDSLNNAVVIIEIERRFGVRLDSRRVGNAANITALAQMIANTNKASM